jgi:hypothetical protein
MADDKAQKRVDEDWKKRVQDEKARGSGTEPAKAEPAKPEPKDKAEPKENASRAMPPADFMTFVGGLAAQTLIHLGQMENPITGKTEQDLEQARYMIDLLRMLKDKTKGNLTDMEARGLDAILFELHMGYVKLAGRD